jgi:monoamine oxidase
MAEVLDRSSVSAAVRAHATGLRNFWVADPDQLSALVAAAQIIDGDPGKTAMFHIVGGNDQLVNRLHEAARCEVQRRHIVRAVEWNERSARVSIEGPSGRVARAAADYVVLAMPAALLGDVKISPGLPEAQRTAITSLETGPATKALLRFSRAWWRKPGMPRAYGSDLAIGAVWDASEAQPKAALMALLAGGRASASLRRLIDRRGAGGVASQLQWFNGGPPETPQMHAVSWEHDPWARGAYAYFSPKFDPALRPLLARAAGRIFFAGCHTSREYQGYMNGAVESGIRAAEEIAAIHHI